MYRVVFLCKISDAIRVASVKGEARSETHKRLASDIKTIKVKKGVVRLTLRSKYKKIIKPQGASGPNSQIRIT
jgi:hypothetical protein